MHWCCDYSRDPSPISGSGCRWSSSALTAEHYWKSNSYTSIPFYLSSCSAWWETWLESLLELINLSTVSLWQISFSLNRARLLVRKIAGQQWSPQSNSPLLLALNYPLSELLLKTGEKCSKEAKVSMYELLIPTWYRSIQNINHPNQSSETEFCSISQYIQLISKKIENTAGKM